MGYVFACWVPNQYLGTFLFSEESTKKDKPLNGTTKWVFHALWFYSYFLDISLSFLKPVLLVACVSSVVIHFPNFAPDCIK